MNLVNITLVIWALVTVYSTYNLYSNTNYLQDEKVAKENIEALIGKKGTFRILILMLVLVIGFDWIAFAVIYSLYKTKVIIIAILMCLALDVIGICLFKKTVSEQLEILRQCVRCFIAVMAMVYMFF